MKSKKGDISIETIVKWAIVILMLFILLVIIFRNSDAMKGIWEKILGVL